MDFDSVILSGLKRFFDRFPPRKIWRFHTIDLLIITMLLLCSPALFYGWKLILHPKGEKIPVLPLRSITAEEEETLRRLDMFLDEHRVMQKYFKPEVSDE